MRCILVLLTGAWDPDPHYDPANASTFAPTPRDRVHNSRWVQLPGRLLLEADETQQEAILKPYVQAVVRQFGHDTDRVLLLDLWDQPDHDNRDSYGTMGERVPATQDARGQELDALQKALSVERLIPRVLQWAREVGELAVPLTIAMWSIPEDEHWMFSNADLFLARDRLRGLYLSSSDVISFHNYANATRLMSIVSELQRAYPSRPIICSSYMSRETASTLDPILGRLYSANVWAFNWGLVAGKTQIMYNASTWNVLPPEQVEPNPWHQDILRSNGTLYWETERDYLLSYRPIDERHNNPIKFSGVDGSESSNILVIKGLLIGATAVFLLAGMTIWWHHRERKRFSAVAGWENRTFMREMELPPVD